MTRKELKKLVGMEAGEVEDYITELLNAKQEKEKRDKILMSGYQPNGFAGAAQMQSALYDLVDNSNRPLFLDNIREGEACRLAGMPLTFSNNGARDYMRALLQRAAAGA